MATGIATLVCYAGIFNDVIGVEEMAERLGVSGSQDFYSTLNQLHRQGRLVVRDGFASLPDLADKIDLKPGKQAKAAALIDSHRESIGKITQNPLVQFVGVSGSLAAGNPVKDRNNQVDVDLFLIVRRQCLWLYVIPRKLWLHLPWIKHDHALCMNYVMDASHLRVTNRNFYTATEIRNLIPVAGKEAFEEFLAANAWVQDYYPSCTIRQGAGSQAASSNFINKACFLVFTLLRCVRQASLQPMRKLSFRSDSLSGLNFNRLWHPNGGYQGLVQQGFTRLATAWFPDLLDSAHIERLFPDELSIGIRQGQIDVCHLSTDTRLGYDYRKYA